MKTFLTIAGSDCIGGAGLQADLKTAALHEFYGASVVSAVTSQNSSGLRLCSPVDNDLFISQLEAVFDDFTPDAIKIGLLPNVSQIIILSEFLQKKIQRDNMPSIVLDPVMSPTLGKAFSEEVNEISKAISSLLAPMTSLITPNSNELRCLLNNTTKNTVCKDTYDIISEYLYENSISAMLITGGDSCNNLCTDILYEKKSEPDQSKKIVRISKFSSTKISTPNLHGTGCVLSSAIACNLADNPLNLPSAINTAKQFILKNIISNADKTFGSGYGPVLWC